MSEDLIVKHCSPTLAGLKTANLFSCPYSSKTELLKAAARYNRVFNPKGVKILPLKFGKDRALIYVFRPTKLQEDLVHPMSREILSALGYKEFDFEKCLKRLAHRINTLSCFPHEIGLFLGYPPEDVKGFILHKGNCCKCCGCWKVYGNEELAEREFAKFKKCSDIYYSKWLSGTPIIKLTVLKKSA